MADDQHNWPAWDADKGELLPSGEPASAAPADELTDEPTRAVRGQLPDDATQVHQWQSYQPDDATQVYQRQSYPPDDATRAIPPVQDEGQGLSIFDEPTVRGVPAVSGVYRADDEPPEVPGKRLRSGVGRAMMITGAALGVLVLAYGIDLLVSWGDVPRGVTVAGVDVGGMTRTEAEQKLRQELQPRFDEPVKITAGDVQTTLNPSESGLGVDWQATLEHAGTQPLSPITRFTSLWTEREVGIEGKSDEPTLRNAIERLADEEINHKKREGDIKFKDAEGAEGAVTPVAVKPRQGQQLGPLDQAMATIEDTWLQRDGVRLAVDAEPVKATEGGVQATLDELAKPAVASPIEFDGEGVSATLLPKEIGEAFEFKPSGDGSLKATIDQETLKKALSDDLKPSEKEGSDAEIVFSGGKPTVKPAKAGRKVNWGKTLKPYLDVIKKTDERVLTVTYSKKNPEVTTAEAKKLGIKEVIGEFTTGGFASDSGVNIRTVAAKVNGAIVKPGDTFSLNSFTGPRNAGAGYVPAGIIENGVPGRAVGGGISQFATTLFNASYFAGMKDAGHREHSFYISRYPIAREATVFQTPSGASAIDIAFTNDSDTGVAIQTSWSPDSITVKIWGTKRYRVESKTSEKSNVKKPGTRTLSNKNCSPSPGIAGFTATDTRILYDIDSGNEVRRESRTARYNPKPKIECKDDSD